MLELLSRWLSALILLQTLWFKFTGAPESVWIFTQLGMEPWGRILSGVTEAVAAALLLSGKTSLIGALIAIPVMLGAILSHIFVLGIVVQGDGGLLFMLATLVFAVACFVIFRNRPGFRRLLQNPLRYLQSLA